VDEFGFEGVEEALHRRVIPTISFPAHRLDDIGCVEHLAVAAGCVLASAVGVMDEPRTWTLALDRHGQGGDGQLLAHVIAHRPAHYLAAEQIEDGGQVQPPLIGRDVGDVRQPNLIRPGGQEGLVEQIVGNRQAMIAVGGDDPEAALGHRSNAMAMHQPLDPAAADEAPFRAQGRVDARGAVAAAVTGMDTPDSGQQRPVRRHPRALRAATPSVIAAARDFQRIAHQAHRPGVAVIFDEAELHFGGSEKMATVFFRMSRSMRSRWTSRRRRAISANWSSGVPACGATACVLRRCDTPAGTLRTALRHLRNIDG